MLGKPNSGADRGPAGCALPARPYTQTGIDQRKGRGATRSQRRHRRRRARRRGCENRGRRRGRRRRTARRPPGHGGAGLRGRPHQWRRRSGLPHHRRRRAESRRLGARGDRGRGIPADARLLARRRVPRAARGRGGGGPRGGRASAGDRGPPGGTVPLPPLGGRARSGASAPARPGARGAPLCARSRDDDDARSRAARRARPDRATRDRRRGRLVRTLGCRRRAGPRRLRPRRSTTR